LAVYNNKYILRSACVGSENTEITKSLKIHTEQLEIWGKAQRKSARRPKSDWEKFKGVKFPR